jgi:hypothetical protein
MCGVFCVMIRAALDSKVLSSVRMMGNGLDGRPNIALFLGHCKICKICMYEGITVAHAGQPAVKETG